MHFNDPYRRYPSADLTNGKQNVIITNVGAAQARNREFAAVSTRESCTWTEGVTEVTITVFQEAAGTAELRAVLGVCFDAPSDLVADTWLTHADSKAVDSNMSAIPAGESRTFYFTNAITRLDVIRLYGSEALGVIVEAA